MAQVATRKEDLTKEIGPDDAPPLQRVKSSFPNLEIIELIGRGGMGFVYKARQPHLDRQVALKLLPEHLAKEPQFAERFNREGRVLAKLNHPSIVSVFDFGQSGDFYFLLMEYVDGVNLRQAMQTARFSPEEALNVVPRICEALQYAHEQGVLHRDIKPENILLDAKGQVKIADFGIAKLIGEPAGPQVTLTNTGSTLGTVHYMAPEQIEQPGAVDHRADIYSLGVVFYEMLTGELPIGRFEPPSNRTQVSKGVDDAVFRALERNRERRQKSAGEFKTQVETAHGQPTPPPPPLPQHKVSYCWPGIFGAGLVAFSLMVFLAGGAVMAARGGITLSELILIGIPLLLIIVTGTILGWIGLSQIRHSNSTKKGLPLALFAALTIPFGLPAFLAIGIPSTMILTTSQEPNLPLRVALFLAISCILSGAGWGTVAISRWAANRPNRKYWSTRGWATTTATLTALATLLTLTSSSEPLHTTNLTPSPVENTIRKTPLTPAVHVQFHNVNLTHQQGQDRLELTFTLYANNAQLSWHTDGSFDGIPVDLTQATHIDATTGEPTITDTASILLPPSMTSNAKQQLLQQVRNQWQDQPLLVRPGDEYKVMTIVQSKYNIVVVTLKGRDKNTPGA